MSARSWKTMTATDTNIKMAITTGVSTRCTWSRNRRPMPGQAKIRSVTIAPANNEGRSRPTMVTRGSEAFFSA